MAIALDAREIGATKGRMLDPGRLLWLGFAALVTLLALVPFALVVAISFGEKIEGAGWAWGLDATQYRRFFVGLGEDVSFLYARKLVFSFLYAGIAAVIAVALAFPFAWALTRLSRPAQTAWLVALLSAVSFSEVFVVMGWDIALSNRSGLPMVLRETGVTQLFKDMGWFQAVRDLGLANPRDFRFKPSHVATVLCMAYLVFPYAVILLYPALSRLDPATMEAARTMGAGPGTVMRTVVLPQVRLPLVGTTLLLFVFLLGVYVTVTQFAAPPHQTMTISIYEAVRGATLNAPFGAAQAVVLLVTAGLCLAVAGRLAKERGA